MQACSIDGCERPRRSRGWCSRHYQRWVAHGDPLVACWERIQGGWEARFWAKVDKRGPDECWEWTAYRQPHRGYGLIGDGKESWLAHRLSWTIHNGPIPAGMIVRHHCDNPSCVNPAHLGLGTMVDNMRDRDTRGRNGVAKLTEADVRAIRGRGAAGEDARQIAEHLPVAVETVRAILQGKTWRHVS